MSKNPANKPPLEWWLSQLGLDNTGASQYFTRCPAHSDKGPSLHITPKGNGKDCLVHCFAGCKYDAILSALETRSVKVSKPSKPKEEAKPDPEISESALEWWQSYTGIPSEFWKSLGVDEDEAGKFVCFTFPNGAVKGRPKGTKEFKWSANGKPPDLWPLPTSALPETVYLTEGESDCGILRFLGFEAFALTKGVGSKLPKNYLSGFAQFGVSRIVTCFDYDDPGDEGRAKLSESLAQTEIEAKHASLGALTLPFSGEKDLRDLFLRLGKEALREKLDELFSFEAEAKRFRPLMQRIENLPMIDWLWGGMIPRRTVLLFTGPPKVGKSTFLFKLFNQMREGGMIATRPVSSGKIVYVTEEGDQTLANKASIFGPLENVSVAIAADMIAFDWDSLVKATVSHAREIAADTIVIDPFAHFARFEPGEENDASAVLSRIKPLLELREEFTVILVHHSNKQGSTRGSTAIDGAVDGILAMTKGLGNLRVIVSTNRIEESTATLNVNPKTGAESVILVPAKEHDKAEAKKAILDWMRENPGKHSSQDIRKATGQQKATRELTSLFKSGEVEKEDHPVFGSVYFLKE